MNTITLNTHKTIQRLQVKGFTPEQAEGIVDALTESELVTKTFFRNESLGCSDAFGASSFGGDTAESYRRQHID